MDPYLYGGLALAGAVLMAKRGKKLPTFRVGSNTFLWAKGRVWLVEDADVTPIGMAASRALAIKVATVWMYPKEEPEAE